METGETSAIVTLIPLVYAFDALRRRYADREDVFVVLGAPNRPRHSYLLWKEPKGPDFVLEILCPAGAVPVRVTTDLPCSTSVLKLSEAVTAAGTTEE